MLRQTPRIDFIAERSKLTAGRDQTVDVLIRVRPPEPAESSDGTRTRPTMNLSLVLDRSGSMTGQKIMRAREAAAYCIDQLLPSDRVSVVIFDDVVETLIPSQLAENKPDLKERLAQIAARNSTALHEAWVRGGLEVSKSLTEGAINRVLLVTDGRANVGITSTDEIVSQSKGLADRGVTTSTIGVGDDFNEDLLLPMAGSGGGNAWHVEKPEDMQSIFSVELEGLIAQVGHSVTMGLIPSDGIRLVDLLNDFEMNETGRYKLPNLQAGSPIDLVVQLRIPAASAGTEMRLLDLRFGYTPQDRSQAEVIKQSFEIGFCDQSEIEALAVNPEVGRAVQLLMNARARREAVERMDRGDLAGAQQVVAAALGRTHALPAAMAQSSTVREEVRQLEDLSEGLADPSQNKMNRKRLQYQSDQLKNSKSLG